MRPVKTALSCLASLVASAGLAQPPTLESVSPESWATVESWIFKRFPSATIVSAALFPMAPPDRSEGPQSGSESLDELLTRVSPDREQALGVIVRLPDGALRTLRFRPMDGDMVPENPLIDP
jgi:hypothetical protein